LEKEEAMMAAKDDGGGGKIEAGKLIPRPFISGRFVLLE